MGNITDINKAVILEAVAALGADTTVDTVTKIPHSEKGHMVVGEQYEMYAGVAKDTGKALGITFANKDYSFTYAGTITMMGELYIVTKDTHYGGKVVPQSVQFAFDELRDILGGVSPLCPTYIARKFIRPKTD